MRHTYTLSAENKTSLFLRKLTPVMLFMPVLLYISSLSRNWKPEWDSAYYLIIAKSILSGEGFSYLGYPCLKIPFGFPLLISPVMNLTGTSIFALNAFMLFFAGISILSIYFCFKRLFSPFYSALIVFFTALSPLMLTYAGYIMIEMPYMAFSYLSLFFIIRFTSKRPSSLMDGLISVLFILTCFFLRTVGIALIGGAFLYMLLYRRRLLLSSKVFFLTLLMLIPVFLWVRFQNSTVIDSEDPVWQLPEFITSKNEIKRYRFDDPLSKINGPADVLRRGVKNAGYYAGVLSSLVSGIKLNPKKENLRLLPVWFLVILGLITLVFLAGMAWCMVKKTTVLDFYFLLYMGILLSWSAREPRYLLPVLPLIIHYSITGVLIVITGIENSILLLKKNYSVFVPICLLLSAAYYIIVQGTKDLQIIARQQSNNYYSRSMQDFFAASGWLRTETLPDTRVVSVSAPVAAHFSQRWCVSFPRINDPDTILNYIDKIDCHYLLLNPSYGHEEKYLKAAIDKYPQYFRREKVCGDAIIYNVNQSILKSSLEHR